LSTSFILEYEAVLRRIGEMTSFPLRLPEDLKEKAAAQAEAAGVSLNQYITVALASHVGGRAEAEHYFNARARRTAQGRAKAILAKTGSRSQPRPEDRRNSKP
jgi:hypothetical protein